jgi:hypothetical protein
MPRSSRPSHSILTYVVAGLLALALSSQAGAAEVRFIPSVREAFVSQPIELRIEIENAGQFQRPELPKITGAAVNPVPAESKGLMTEIINGRATTRRIVSLTYRIVPFQAGTITIPSLTVIADGQSFASQPIDIIVTQMETAASGDLMFAEILADRLSIYLGESLRLRLRLWIKPYTDRQFGLRLNADQMWSLIDQGATTWGDFKQALPPQRGPFGTVTITGEEVIRSDEQGNRGAYFRYDIETTIWPTQTGALQLQQPLIVMNYPQRLVKQNDFFSRGNYSIADSRPISVTAEPPPVEIITTPAEGQPETFNGAVGNYSISVSARPLEVSVGDPITLTITVRDHGEPESAAPRLSLLPPPPLDRVDELANNFRVPSDPLAGTVGGASKTFTQTIRAKSEAVARIPPIPISFFDPSTEAYVTHASEPIPITVKAGSQIGVNDVIAAPSTASPQTHTELKELGGGLMANYSADEALAPVKQFRLTALLLATLIAPPLAFLVIAATRTSARFRRRNAAAIRRRSAGKRAMARINDARTDGPRAQAQATLAAFGDYFADRLNLPSRAITSAQIANLLRERAAHASLVAETEALLDQCEQLVYSGAAVEAMHEDLVHRAATVVKQLERARLS